MLEWRSQNVNNVYHENEYFILSQHHSSPFKNAVALYKVLYLPKGMSFLLCGSAKAKIEEGATPIKGLGGEKIST